MKQLLLMLFVAGTLFTSCSKNEEELPTPQTSQTTTTTPTSNEDVLVGSYTIAAYQASTYDALVAFGFNFESPGFNIPGMCYNNINITSNRTTVVVGPSTSTYNTNLVGTTVFNSDNNQTLLTYKGTTSKHTIFEYNFQGTVYTYFYTKN